MRLRSLSLLLLLLGVGPLAAQPVAPPPSQTQILRWTTSNSLALPFHQQASLDAHAYAQHLRARGDHQLVQVGAYQDVGAAAEADGFPHELQLRTVAPDLLAEPLTNSVQADRRNMVLCARVVTAADLDADISQIFRHLTGRKHFCERSGHPL